MAGYSAPRILVRGVYFDNVTLDEASDRLRQSVRDGVRETVFTPNSEIVQACIDEPALYDVVNAATLVIPDGIGVVKASRILKTPLKGKVAGVDLGKCVISFAAEDGVPVYLLGGKPGVAETASDKLCAAHAGLRVVGARDGYFAKAGEETDEVVRAVNESGAQVLFVCLGAPAQEKWIVENRDRMPHVRVFLGLGGSLDVYAGTVKRAPKIFIRLGLEWFYRLLKEPRRIGRMMRLPKFYFGTWIYKMRKK